MVRCRIVDREFPCSNHGQCNLSAVCEFFFSFFRIVVSKQRNTYGLGFVLEFYGLVNNEVMSCQSVNSGTVPGQA